MSLPHRFLQFLFLRSPEKVGVSTSRGFGGNSTAFLGCLRNKPPQVFVEQPPLIGKSVPPPAPGVARSVSNHRTPCYRYSFRCGTLSYKVSPFSLFIDCSRSDIFKEDTYTVVRQCRGCEYASILLRSSSCLFKILSS